MVILAVAIPAYYVWRKRRNVIDEPSPGHLPDDDEPST
jgi:hypothetical protein